MKLKIFPEMEKHKFGSLNEEKCPKVASGQRKAMNFAAWAISYRKWALGGNFGNNCAICAPHKPYSNPICTTSANQVQETPC